MIIVRIKRSRGFAVILRLNWIFLLCTCFVSCKKFIEVEAPPTSLNSGNVYSTDATATAVLTNIYADFSLANINMRNSDHIANAPLYLGLASDELVLFHLNHPWLVPYYRNDLSPLLVFPIHWSNIYSKIFNLNSAIEGLNNASTLTNSVKSQLLGEALFMRSYFYFYLVNLYGGVPLVLNLDWKGNALLPRASVSQVYQQIISDLKQSINLLSENYLALDLKTSTMDRLRPNKWVAKALLARTYLFSDDWINAEAEASDLINNPLFKLETADNVFKKGSKEAIWQLQPIFDFAGFRNSGEGRLFILPAAGPNLNNNPVYLSSNVTSAFEINDIRKSNWISSVTVGGNTYYYPYKYKLGDANVPSQEFSIIFRLAEQYLIRAEARAMQNKLQLAIDDVNEIRLKHGGLIIPLTLPVNQSAAINTILHERQVELFTEWGHRWLDLKRTGNINAIMGLTSTSKGSTWAPYKSLFPIPQEDLNKDPKLIQNPGY